MAPSRIWVKNMVPKALIRKQILAVRNAMDRQEQERKSSRIAHKFLESDDCQKAAMIYLYAGYGSEALTQELCGELFTMGKRIAMPRVAADGIHMDFYEIQNYNELTKGYRGILEPDASKGPAGPPDLLVMPGAAFDRKCNRIGYGKGFYDRYLTRYPKLKTVAFAFECQIVDEIPAEPHDYRPDVVITEDRNIKKEIKKMYNEILLDEIDLNQEPPVVEPERQYYFMAKCRRHVEDESRRLGRPLTAAVITFGCQMNARDSEKLEGILSRIGYEKAESEEQADFVIFNTCTVRDNANQRVYGHLGVLKKNKRENPGMIIGLCGCMMQEPSVIEKIKKSYPHVEMIFGTHNIYRFAELIYNKLTTQGLLIDIWEDTDKIVENLPSDRKYPFKSGINIMFGCNNFCSYCIVPYVRGRERSRKPEDIIQEIKELSADGVVEIMLLGQNVNSYGKTLDTPLSFAGLLREIEKIEGIRRIRFMTSHPKDLSDELIQVMKESKKICRHLHLPLQSGSSRILKEMNRRYDKEQYLNLALKIRREIPDIAITTDIIVGFPGETHEDVNDTLDVIEKVRFDNAFTFLYSKRTGTPAAAMENQIAKEVAQREFDRVLSRVQEISKEMTERFTGQTMDVLVEEVNAHDPSLVTGRLTNNNMVHFRGGSDLIGKIVDVRLVECRGFYYMGEMVCG